MKSFRYLTALGAFLGLFMIPTASDAVLISSKSLGMAGVGIAYPQDALAAANNPATAADLDSRYDLGLIFAHLKGKVTTVGNLAAGGLANGTVNAYHRQKNFYCPTFGFNYAHDENLSLGLVVYNRNLSKTTTKNPNILIGTSRAGIEYLNETVSPYIAYRWGCHNFGISVNWQIQRLKVNGFQNVQPFSVSPDNVTNKGYNWANGVGFTFGWSYHVTDDIQVGVTYQPETQMSRFKKYKGFLANGGKFNIPEKIGAGISWRFIQCATVAFDYEYIHWKQNRAVKNPLLASGIPTLPIGINQLGANNGPGFGWKDAHYFRVGADYAWSEDWTFRAGYRYSKTVIRKSQTALNAFTMEPLVESIVTAGATWNLNCSDEVDFFGAYGFQKKLKGQNSIPAFLGFGNANLKQDLWAIGIQWGHKF